MLTIVICKLAIANYRLTSVCYCMLTIVIDKLARLTHCVLARVTYCMLTIIITNCTGNLLQACKAKLLNAFNCNLQSYNGKLHVYYDNLSG